MSCDAIVIGGGLAGTGAAYALTERGFQVTLIERHDQLAAEASGNKAGVLKPIITAPQDIVGQFSLAAYDYAIKHYPSVLKSKNAYNFCGVLQLTKELRGKTTPPNIAHLARDCAYPVTSAEASQLSGITIHHDGVFFPQGGWVSPRNVCQVYAQTVKTLYHSEAITLERVFSDWQVKDANGEVVAMAPLVIIACAYHTKRLAQTNFLPLRPIRGQVTHLPETPYSKKLRTVISHTGTLIPSIDGVHIVGSTFEVDDTKSDFRHAGGVHNLKVLGHYLPELVFGMDGTSLEGRAALRANAPDRMPIVGAIPNRPGLYVSTGFGSRGLTHMPFATSLLMMIIEEKIPDVYAGFVKRLAPGRFAVNDCRPGNGRVVL